MELEVFVCDLEIPETPHTIPVPRICLLGGNLSRSLPGLQPNSNGECYQVVAISRHVLKRRLFLARLTLLLADVFHPDC